ncbi:unnamed protein product [Adineta ricciae]|uniref:PABC domain-containing protein n=1 Tax=Adineta ricciae TaxID=249248 RepID=A0A815IZE8_ADIRI|nr:unnamed protein product [Adineta ricciae]CAF1568473.1 unnamed protein product [Adineta ricciae]
MSSLASELASISSPEQQKEFLGNKLFPLVLERVKHPDITSKVTGELLELDNDELCRLIDSHDALSAKIDEVKTEIEACEPSSFPK